MNIFRSLAVAATVVLLPTMSLSAPIAAGVYEVSDLDGFRTIWTPGGNNGPNGNALVTGGHASAYWSFSGGLFDFDGTNASLTALATNTGATELQFDVNLSFTLTGEQDGYCQFAGGDPGCDNGTDYLADFGVDPSTWTYFDFDGGTFAGLSGTVMDSIVYNISDNADHRPQAGHGANALEADDFGFSMWFLFDNASGSGQTVTSALTGDTYRFNNDGNGDINADLSAVPLPAAGWLLLASFGGLAAAKRRRKAA